MLNWPCIIKYSDNAELTYVANQADWDNNADLYDLEYDESDFLIDSSGNLFNLTKRENKSVTPEPVGRSMSLNEILGLVKAHAAQKGSCCVAKLYAPTIAEAFRIVASLNDE